ncbi:cytochrome c [Novosphingobium sp. Gsoil 351]|uniref:SorB family sulfite dehydrogenase c-type cytochrome subunit n=1 Tax=Novosphingobium sp. Gsoil 351 TaxID=2675225 RepID=UPI0012B48BA4|nr:cytochrome c [Novosphingobium sp. Gsoil 351]QGN53949.1 cytochrome c [Novosphingobium sp. Gsoil 351]
MIRWLAFGVAASLCGLAVCVSAKPVKLDLPLEKTPLELATADAEVVVNNCSACHSLDYIVTQPRGKGEEFWRAAVAKMVNVYKAPVSTEDADAIAKVLGRKFG